MRLFYASALALVSLFAASALADSCQIINDEKVVDNALAILAKNYPGEERIELKQGPAKSYPVDVVDFAIENPRKDSQGAFFLLVDLVSENGAKRSVWLDLGFTFFRDRATGKYLNLAKAAGCRVFGGVYDSIDEIPAD